MKFSDQYFTALLFLKTSDDFIAFETFHGNSKLQIILEFAREFYAENRCSNIV